VWIKSNPMPNFRGVRFTNAHETLIWAQKKQGAKYIFNHQAMKALNDDLQMRSDWTIPLATGKQRLKVNGTKAHSTQKPEGLLHRVILSSTQPGDVVLDPFFGSGTTGAVAKRLGRQFIGIERDQKYIKVALKRIADIETGDTESLAVTPPRPKRIPFGSLLEIGKIAIGQTLYFAHGNIKAKVLADGHIKCKGQVGSIHAIAKALTGAPVNGWDVWLYEDRSGNKRTIDSLREEIRKHVDK
jgi:modification methylase